MSPDGRYGDGVEIRVAGAEGWIAFECDDRGQVEDITLRLGPLLGHVEATIGLDLSAMRDDLSRALSSPTLTGRTSIESANTNSSFGSTSRMARASPAVGSRRSSPTTEASTLRSRPISRIWERRLGS